MRLKITQRILFLASALLFLLASGCGRVPNQAEESTGVSDQIGKARLFARQGDYRKAVEMYQKAEVLEPDNADVYLQLGIIYDDSLKDKNLAIAYYQEFLRRDPESKMADRVRQWLGETLPASPDKSVSPPVRMNSPVPVAPVEALSLPPTSPRAQPRPTAIVISPPAVVPSTDTYTVRGGDTLVKIASELYGNPSGWNRIYQANRDQLKNPHALKVGQVLTIPRGQP